jgi:hypothetical protein
MVLPLAMLARRSAFLMSPSLKLSVKLALVFRLILVFFPL